ncbi:hypothetical protein chiPu_0017878 [Chiloscyllium punctatum]|uniref:Methyltransferase domain-containing protein n=1 Tax=Chiloscyllium punctatum TaxID=137246 RepID=A0A401RJI6_CHIPU|nr:hypothetical protein [Chiloscyllium punctatum]
MVHRLGINSQHNKSLQYSSSNRMAESGRDKDSSIQNIRTVYSIKNPEEKVKFYNTWATRYEKDLALINYQAHTFAAEILDPVFPKKREDALVLDIACGTGGVAEQLQKRGFRNFHGIDGSEGMLKIAESKGLYQNLKKCLIVPGERLPVSSGNKSVPDSQPFSPAGQY